jgi:hypothetical protein
MEENMVTQRNFGSPMRASESRFVSTPQLKAGILSPIEQPILKIAAVERHLELAWEAMGDNRMVGRRSVLEHVFEPLDH